MQNDLSPVEEKLLEIWREQYPILYWANRVNKINPLNAHDELEAIFTLLHLADAYVTNFVANVRNPHNPWYFVKERAYPNHIRNTLDQFKSGGTGRIDLRNYDQELENVTSLEPREGWEVSTPTDNRDASPLDLFVGFLLGCPAAQDFDQERLVFQEDPDQYIKVCNGVINFRENWEFLLNDLKHGFRLLPFEWKSIEELLSISVGTAPGLNLDAKKEEYESTREDYVYFWRLVGRAGKETEQFENIPEGLEAGSIGLIVYRIEIDVCRGLARTINLLLHNLIRTEPVPIVEELEPFVDESGQVDTFEEFIPITMLVEE